MNGHLRLPTLTTVVSELDEQHHSLVWHGAGSRGRAELQRTTDNFKQDIVTDQVFLSPFMQMRCGLDQPEQDVLGYEISCWEYVCSRSASVRAQPWSWQKRGPWFGCSDERHGDFKQSQRCLNVKPLDAGVVRLLFP